MRSSNGPVADVDGEAEIEYEGRFTRRELEDELVEYVKLQFNR